MPDDETTLDADGLRVVFFRRGDRVAHRIEVFDTVDGAWRAACESLEGADDDCWPPSPPFQQLHVEQRAQGPVVLLIGMAGRTHWSAAVEVTADGRGICFDVAARCQTPPEYLGSNYPHVAASQMVQLSWTALTAATLITHDERFSDGKSIRPWGEFAAPPATIAWKYAVAAPLPRP